jgi:hypothetical protein
MEEPEFGQGMIYSRHSFPLISSANGKGTIFSGRPEHHRDSSAPAPRAAKTLGQPPQGEGPTSGANQGFQIELTPEIAVASVL